MGGDGQRSSPKVLSVDEIDKEPDLFKVQNILTFECKTASGDSASSPKLSRSSSSPSHDL